MRTEPHPTHHRNHRPGRLVAAVLVSLAGVFFCAVVIGVPEHGSPRVHELKGLGLAAGALAFVGGFVVAALRELLHAFPRCPSCSRILRRSGRDHSATYYPCRRCEVTWTCPCCESADG